MRLVRLRSSSTSSKMQAMQLHVHHHCPCANGRAPHAAAAPPVRSHRHTRLASSCTAPARSLPPVEQEQQQPTQVENSQEAVQPPTQFVRRSAFAAALQWLASGASLSALAAEGDGQQQGQQGVGSDDPSAADAAAEQRTPRRQRLKPRELGKLLGLSEDAAKLIMERVPELVGHPVQRLKAALQRLGQVLKVDERAACTLAIKQPRVLLVPADQLSPRLADLARMLKVNEDAARALCRQQPGLLSHRQETLRARLAALVALIKECLERGDTASPARLDTKQQQQQQQQQGGAAIAHPAATAANMLRREPGLLALSHAQLANRLTALSTALGSPGNLIPGLQLAAQAPTVVLLPPSRTASLVATLATLLSLPTRAAGDLLIRHPPLLARSPEALAGSMRALGSALGVEREAAAIMCSEQPALLLVKPDELPGRMQALQSALGVNRERLVQLLAIKPQLLLKEAKNVNSAIQAARKRGELPPS